VIINVSCALSILLMQVGMVAESIRTIARGFQLNPRDPLTVVSLLEVIARERSAAIAAGVNATAVTAVALELSNMGDIRATKALAELYNSGGHYGHARDLLARALTVSKGNLQIGEVRPTVDPHWSAKCLLMNLAHAGERLPSVALCLSCSILLCSC
jgi:hypothetical protein